MDPRDELAAMGAPTPEQEAAAHRLICATRVTQAEFDATSPWADDVAFLPTEPRPEVPVGTSIAWADIMAMYERMLSTPARPAQLEIMPQSWDLTAAGRPPVLSTEHPFPIRYSAPVWEQLHPIGRRV